MEEKSRIKPGKSKKEKNNPNNSKAEKKRSENKVNNIIKNEEFKKGQIREIVLAALGISVLLGGSILITPNFPIVFASILGLIKEFTEKKPTNIQVKRVLKNLEKKEIISLEKKGEEVYVKLKGWLSPKVLKYSLKGILDYKRKKKEWKGKWFLVIFDVPEEQRNKRDYLRRFLNYIGFFPYQQSVYIYPYECSEEIALVKKMVEGGKYISYVIADSIENEDAVKRHFQLKK